jgi:hypothetical protein
MRSDMKYIPPSTLKTIHVHGLPEAESKDVWSPEYSQTSCISSFPRGQAQPFFRLQTAAHFSLTGSTVIRILSYGLSLTVDRVDSKGIFSQDILKVGKVRARGARGLIMTAGRVDVEKSCRLTSRVLLAAMLGMMPFAALLPGTSPPSEAAFYMHLTGMAALAFLACVAFETMKTRILAVFFVFAFSVLMELLQSVLPYRHGTMTDVYINAMGCAAGFTSFLAASGIWKLRQRAR